MRILTRGVIVGATRSSLTDLEFLHLDGRDVEQLTAAMHECSNLVSLSLSRNQLRAPLAPLARCSELWHINLSHNRLESLEGLQHFVAIGSLQLAHNRLPPHELRWLRDVEIVHLTLEGNPATARILKDVAQSHTAELGGSGGGGERSVCASYRPAVLAVVPTPWTLDGQFVVAAERVAALRMVDAVTDSLDRSASQCVVGGSTGAAGRTLNSFEWGCGAWDIGASTWVGELAVRHLNLIRDQPTTAIRPESLDVFRLRLLVGSLPSGKNIGILDTRSNSSLEKGYIEEDAARCNGFLSRQIYGEKPSEWPQLHLAELSKLDREVRLDVLVALAADVLYGPLPPAVLTGALIILAATTVGSTIATAVAALPSFAKTALCFALRAQLQAEAEAVPGGYLFSSDPDKLELLMAVPIVVAPPSPQLPPPPPPPPPPLTECADRLANDGMTKDGYSRSGGTDKQNGFKSSSSGEDLSMRGTFARHASLVLSRAPACPALTAFARLNPAAQRVYDAMLPLLEGAGFASSDLELRPKVGGPVYPAHNPQRPYERTRMMVRGGGDGGEGQAAVGVCDGSEGGAGAEEPYSPPGSRPDTVYPAGDFDPGIYSTGDFMRPDDELDDFEGEAEGSSNLLHVRKPRAGERVLREQGRFVYVAWVEEDGSFMRVGGGGGVTEDATAVVLGTTLQTVLRKDVVWDPRGWWIHTSALVEDNQRHARRRSQRLFPVRSIEKLHASGVAAAAGMANVAVPAIATSYAASSEELEQAAPGLPQTKARVVSGFIANAAWDTAFVIAPPSAVALQNMVAQAAQAAEAEVPRPFGEPMSGTWSDVTESPYIVGIGAPTMANDVPYRLAPRSALASKVVKSVQAVSERAQQGQQEQHRQQKEERQVAVAGGLLGDGAIERAGGVVELEYSEDTRVPVPGRSRRCAGNAPPSSFAADATLEDGQGGMPNVLNNMPSSLGTGSTGWETLQREMGTFCEANLGRPMELPPLTVHELRDELRARKPQLDLVLGSPLAQLQEKESSDRRRLHDEQDRNFFELTSVAGDFDVQLQVAVDNANQDGHCEEPADYQNPASLASNSPNPPSVPGISQASGGGDALTQELHHLRRSASHDSSGANCLQMRLLLQAEIEREKASQMFPGKARVRPWRTLQGKQTFRIAESTLALPHSVDYLSLVQPPILRYVTDKGGELLSRNGSTTTFLPQSAPPSAPQQQQQAGPDPSSAFLLGSGEDGGALEQQEQHQQLQATMQQRARKNSIEAYYSSAGMPEDPTEVSGPRLHRNIFVPGMTPNVRAGGNQSVRRRLRPRGQAPEELYIQRVMTTGGGLQVGGGLRSGGPDSVAEEVGPAAQHSLSGMLNLDVRYEDGIDEALRQYPQTNLGDSHGLDGPAVPGLGWRPAMRPSMSSPATLAMHIRQQQQQQHQTAGELSPKIPSATFATNANSNTIAGYRGFDQSPPPSASKKPKGAVRNKTSAIEPAFDEQEGEIVNRTAYLSKETPTVMLPLVDSASKRFRGRQVMRKSRLLGILKGRTGGSKMRRQKKGAFAAPAGGVRGNLTERTGLRGVTSSDTL